MDDNNTPGNQPSTTIMTMSTPSEEVEKYFLRHPPIFVHVELIDLPHPQTPRTRPTPYHYRTTQNALRKRAPHTYSTSWHHDSRHQERRSTIRLGASMVSVLLHTMVRHPCTERRQQLSTMGRARRSVFQREQRRSPRSTLAHTCR